MADYSEVPVPPDNENYHLDPQGIDNLMTNEHNMDVDSDSLWQQQLVDTEQQILREKESGKRLMEDGHNDDEPASKKLANEFEKLWKNVSDNPTDFQAWTMVLQHIDQSNDLEAGRKAYDTFFLRYPYCYGYWKKYAELEKRKGSLETVLKVFNRGLEAISLSVDLWVHYLDYVMSKYEDNEEFIQQQFEKAIEACGLEFRSDKLWDQYITWESNAKRWKKVTALYERLLAVPISKYLQHWQKFQEHIKQHLPSESMAVDEYFNIRRAVLADLNQTDGDRPDEAPPGVETTSIDDQINVDEEAKSIQKRYIETKQKVHDVTATEAKCRWAFEDAIKRPYFHVKPLEKSQLTAWRNYLNFEICQGNSKRIKVLFERCLIACAFYEEFWMRYIRYLEDQSTSKEELRSVFIRVCNIHLQDKLRPHLAWAAFEEERGNPDAALDILKDIQKKIHFSLEAYVMAVGVERRRGNLEAAEKIYRDCMDVFKTKDDKRAYSSLLIKYARFLSLFKQDPENAVKVIQDGLEQDQNNSNLLLALADHAVVCRPSKIAIAAEAFKTGTTNIFPPSIRMVFAHRYLHFVTESSPDSKSMREALQTLREVQQEVRQAEVVNEDTVSSPNKVTSDSGSSKKQPEVTVTAPMDKAAVAVPTTAAIPNTTTLTASTAAVNGTTTTTPTAQTGSNYQNYQTPQGYSYNQGYSQTYNGPHYQGWGYPSQQGSYGYAQQNWPSYPNYYGQR